mgnify:FL=1
MMAEIIDTPLEIPTSTIIIDNHVDPKIDEVSINPMTPLHPMRVYKTTNIKCERCWRYQGNLCARCVSIIN